MAVVASGESVTKALFQVSQADKTQCFPFQFHNTQIEIQTKQNLLHFGLIVNQNGNGKQDVSKSHVFECHFNLTGKPSITYKQPSQNPQPLSRVEITDKEYSVFIREGYLLTQGIKQNLPPELNNLAQLSSVYFLQPENDVSQNIKITTSLYIKNEEVKEVAVGALGVTASGTGTNALI